MEFDITSQLYLYFLGQTCKFIVNTVNAGAGALAVTVEGPSKVKLECKEVDDGYEFTYNPTAPGDYLITIRYAGTGIAGSPFKAKIEGLCWSSPLTHSTLRSARVAQWLALPIPLEAELSSDCMVLYCTGAFYYHPSIISVQLK